MERDMQMSENKTARIDIIQIRRSKHRAKYAWENTLAYSHYDTTAAARIHYHLTVQLLQLRP